MTKKQLYKLLRKTYYHQNFDLVIVTYVAYMDLCSENKIPRWAINTQYQAIKEYNRNLKKLIYSFPKSFFSNKDRKECCELVLEKVY